MLREKLMDALKKKKKDLSDSEKDAKMEVVKDLRRSASDSMKNRLDGIKKVSVMSGSNEGLEKGLEKAQDIISDSAEHSDKNDDAMKYSEDRIPGSEHESEESDESPEEASDSADEMLEHAHSLDHEALMEHISKLQEIANQKK